MNVAFEGKLLLAKTFSASFHVHKQYLEYVFAELCPEKYRTFRVAVDRWCGTTPHNLLMLIIVFSKHCFINSMISIHGLSLI